MADPRCIIKITEEDYADHSESGGGFCLACGDWSFNVEPDAERYRCESCGEFRVYGAEQALLMGRVQFVDEADD